jgi:hypothetical protein
VLILSLSPSYLLLMGAWLAVLGLAFYGLLRLRRSRRMAGKALWPADAGLSLAMLLAAVTAAELGFALFADFSDTFNVTNVSKRWLKIHIDRERNNEDFRDRRPFTVEIPPGHKRIVFMGDSFTAGHGIKRMEDRFSDRVGAWLDAQAPGRFIVATVAEPGWEISQVEAMIKAFFSKGSSISMIVYVYNLNDIEGYDPSLLQALQQVYTAEPTFFLFRDTYLLNWLYFRYVQFKQQSAGDYFERLRQAYRSRAWFGVRNKLSDIRAACAQHGVELRVAIFPFMHQLGDHYPFREAHAKVVEFCNSQKIPVLDLEPSFRTHAGEDLVVSRFDAHPNERAHAIAAEAIETGLLSDLVRPTSK